MTLAATRRTNGAVAEALTRQADKRSRIEQLEEQLRLSQVENARLQRELAAVLEKVALLDTQADEAALRAHRLARPDVAPGVADTKWGAVPYIAWGEHRCITQKQAATLLNEPQYKVSRWMTSGKIACVSVPPHIHYCQMVDLDALVKPQKGSRKKKS